MNPRIDQRIAPIALAPQTLLMHTTEEVVMDAASGGAWVNRNLRQVCRMGVDGSTSGNIGHAVSVVEAPSPFLIGIFSTSPPCGLNRIKQVENKRQYNSTDLAENTRKMNAVIDGKLPNDLNSASIFSKVIGHKLSNGSSGDLYLHCRMNFADDPVQNQTPKFMDLGFLTINTFDERGDLSTIATRIQRPTDGSHWSASNHVFGEAT